MDKTGSKIEIDFPFIITSHFFSKTFLLAKKKNLHTEKEREYTREEPLEGRRTNN